MVTAASPLQPGLLAPSDSNWSIQGTTMDRHQTEAVSVFEAEQLLLVPDEGQWPLESLELFGLQVKGMQVGVVEEACL